MLKVTYSFRLVCLTCDAVEDVLVTNEGSESGGDWWPSKGFELFMATWNLGGLVPSLESYTCVKCRTRPHFSSNIESAKSEDFAAISRLRQEPTEKTLSSVLPFKSRSELNKCLRQFARHMKSTTRADAKFFDEFRLIARETDYDDQFSYLRAIADAIIKRAKPNDKIYAAQEVDRLFESDHWEDEGEL